MGIVYGHKWCIQIVYSHAWAIKTYTKQGCFYRVHIFPFTFQFQFPQSKQHLVYVGQIMYNIYLFQIYENSLIVILCMWGFLKVAR